jgi:hypothetical protein
MFGDDNFADHVAAEDAKDELRFELAILKNLNAAMKDLNKNWEFTTIINPLFADLGPATAVVQKLKKQIERMKKLKMTSCADRTEKRRPRIDVLLREEEKNRPISCA